MLPTSEQHRTMSYLIEDYLDHLRAANHRDASVTSAASVLYRLHRDLPFGLAYAAVDQLRAWLAHRGWAPATRSAYHKHIKGFYAWATQNGLLDGDPSLLLDRPKAPRGRARPITDQQLAKALAVRAPLNLAVLLAAYGGLRVGEIARCRREHITSDILDIPEGKGGRPGSIPTHPSIWAAIRDRDDGLLVLGFRGQPIDGNWICHQARTAFDDLNMPKVTMHRLRHWYGSSIQREYRDLRVTQECLRHLSVSSTQIYTQVTATQRVAAVASLPIVEPGPASIRPRPATEAA